MRANIFSLSFVVDSGTHVMRRSIWLLLLGMRRGRQVQFARDCRQLLRRQDEDGELREAAVRGVGREDLVVGHLRVVDVLEAPVLEAVDGVRPPILLVCMDGRGEWRDRLPPPPPPQTVWRKLMSAKSNRRQDGVPFSLPLSLPQCQNDILVFYPAEKGILSADSGGVGGVR